MKKINKDYWYYRFIDDTNMPIIYWPKYYYDMFLDWFKDKVGWYDKIRFIRNIPMAYRVACDYCPWDYTFNINMLVLSLINTAKCLRGGSCVNSEKLYKRCMTCAGLLNQAFISDSAYYKALCRRGVSHYKVKFLDHMLGNQMIIDYNINNKEAYHKKMSDMLHKKVEEYEKNKKKEAWDYLSKYIEHFWD